MGRGVNARGYYAIACPATPTQFAVANALKDIEASMTSHLKEYDERRRLMVSLLNDIPGFQCSLPMGAFYAFPSYNHDVTCLELVDKVLGSGVVCIPGCAFGDAGDGHLRFSYATSTETITAGLEKVKEVMEGIEATSQIGLLVEEGETVLIHPSRTIG